MRNSSIKKIGIIASKLEKLAKEFSELEKEVWQKEGKCLFDGIYTGFAIRDAASKAWYTYEHHNKA